MGTLDRAGVNTSFVTDEPGLHSVAGTTPEVYTSSDLPRLKVSPAHSRPQKKQGACLPSSWRREQTPAQAGESRVSPSLPSVLFQISKEVSLSPQGSERVSREKATGHHQEGGQLSAKLVGEARDSGGLPSHSS